MLRVIIADDHALIREGLRKVLCGEPDIAIAGEARNFHELLALAESTEADILLMDVHMPGPPALEALKRIRARQPRLRVIVVSVLPEEQAGLDLLIAGAAGYVPKHGATAELVAAIRKVAEGYRYMSAALSRIVAQAQSRPRENLSPRELEVLCLIAKGLAVKEIATRLSVSVSTVHTHRARVLEKLELRSDVELSRYAIRHGLVEWE